MNTPTFLLNKQSLSTCFSSGTYARGVEVLRNQRVLRCNATENSSGEWAIEGKVKGSGRETYEVSVTITVTPDGGVNSFNGDCSCPVGFECKHCVALTLKAADTTGGLEFDLKPPPVAVKSYFKSGAVPNTLAEVMATIEAMQEARKSFHQPSTPERAQQQAQQKVTQWLNLFADESPQDLPPPDQRTTTQGSHAEVMVFMLIAARIEAQPVLELGVGLSRRLKNGAWAKVKQPRYLNIPGVTAQDQEVVRLIDSLEVQTYSFVGTIHQGVIAGPTGLLALQLAASSGRLFSSPGERMLGVPVTLGPPRLMRFSWRKSKAKSLKATQAAAFNALHDPEWALTPQLADTGPGDQWFSNAPPLYLNSITGVCGPLEMAGISAEHLHLLIKAPPIPESAFALHETTLLRRLAGLPLPPVLKAPELLQGIAPTTHLHFAPVPVSDQPRLGLLAATLHFDYAGLSYFALHQKTPVLIEQTLLPPPSQPSQPSESSKPSEQPQLRRLMLHRDLAAEQAACGTLRGLGLENDTIGNFHLPVTPAKEQQRWLQWADDDFRVFREAGFAVTTAPALSGWINRADDLAVQMTPPHQDPQADDSQSHWFDLSLGMSINGQRHNILPMLPELLAQIGNHSAALEPDDTSEALPSLQFPPYVYLPQPDATYLRLPTEPLRPWLQALLDLVSERGGEFDGASLRLSRLEALRVGAALGAGVQWQGAESLQRMIGQLAGRSALPEVALPTGLLAQLRPYQQQGLEWLQFLRANGLAGILADDMGLGKTLQTLAHILVEKQAGRLDRPVLILAPVSVIGNWRREANRFTPELSALVLHGKDRHEAAADMAQHDLVIAPYSLLQRDRERWQAQAWHLVVLDEAQNIKNANTYAAQVVGELNTRHRLCLSGTPMENHLGELWSLFHFLMPGFLGSQARFKKLYRTPIEKNGDSERLDQLRRRITPFMLRRAKRDVATDLPEKQEAITPVELGDQQADLYETIRLTTEKTVRNALASQGLAKSQIEILDALLKLRQVCCDPRLVPLAAAKKIKQSAKLELLMELLPELLAEGRRVLLFSQFTTMLELIEQELSKRKLSWVKLTGQSQKRDALIERFTSGAVPLFLISLKAGGVGLNLTQADTVIHYDPWWNPAVETQATDRAHRIGQTQRVVVYKLVAQGTIEERILALQERKAALANSLYSAATARKQPLFTESDLAALLRPLGS